MGKGRFISPTRGKAEIDAIDKISNPIFIEGSAPPEAHWINMELVAFSEACCERCGDIRELDPDFYEKQINMEESEMRRLTRMVLVNSWLRIQSIVDNPKGTNEEVFEVIHTYMYLVIRGNLALNRYNKLCFLKPVGARLTYDVQRRIMERIRSDLSIQAEEFINFVKRGNERDRKERLNKNSGIS